MELQGAWEHQMELITYTQMFCFEGEMWQQNDGSASDGHRVMGWIGLEWNMEVNVCIWHGATEAPWLCVNAFRMML